MLYDKREKGVKLSEWHLLFIVIKLFEVKEVKNEFFDWKCIFFQSDNADN